MNARIARIEAIGRAAIESQPDQVDLHAARGILTALAVSSVIWAATIALLLVVWS